MRSMYPLGRCPVYRLQSHIYHTNTSPPCCYTWHNSYNPRPFPKHCQSFILDANWIEYTSSGSLIILSEVDKASDHFSNWETFLKTVQTPKSVTFANIAFNLIILKLFKRTVLSTISATFFSFMWPPVQERPFKSTLSAAISHPVGCLLPYYIAFLPTIPTPPTSAMLFSAPELHLLQITAPAAHHLHCQRWLSGPR